MEPSSGRPLHEQLTTQIEGQIVTGRIAAGERLPAARELAEIVGVNVHTVLRAYQALREAGLVDLRRGRGAVVVDRSTDSPVAAAADRLVRAAKAAGMRRNEALELIERAWQ